MKKIWAVLGVVALLSGCSWIDALNPFSKSGPKMAELTPIKATLSARTTWRQSVGKADLYVFQPAVVGSSVYAAGSTGVVMRIDDGNVTWKIDAKQPLSGGVAADRRMVVVGSPRGEVLAFSAADGKPLWKVQASSEVLAPAAIGGGLVVVRTADNRLAAYDAEDGRRKWVYQRPTPALALRSMAAPLIDDKVVFAGFPGGKLVAVSATNGAAVWEGAVAVPKGATELERIADITSAPVISGRFICAVAYQGRVACFELASGAQAWARDLSSAAGLAIDGRQLYVTDDKGAVHALDLASGASLWKQDKLYLRGVTGPAVRRGEVVVADAEGIVHFLGREDGAFLARVATDGSPVLSTPQLLGSGLVVQTSKGSVFGVEAE